MCKRAPNWDNLDPINGGQLVKRKKTKDYYQQQRMKGLADADLLASHILAKVWSAMRRPEDSPYQKAIQTACVAVSIDASGIYVGSNYLSKSVVTSVAVKDILQLEAPGCYTQNVAVADNSDDKKHAEMQVVEKLWNVYKNAQAIKQATLFIGVSKPCCPRCAQVLDLLGIAYTAKHADKPENWAPPNIPGLM